MDRSKEKVGYEINFTKYFYKFNVLRDPQEIMKDLNSINLEIDNLSKDLRI